jgi:hypothetical protein
LTSEQPPSVKRIDLSLGAEMPLGLFCFNVVRTIASRSYSRYGVKKFSNNLKLSSRDGDDS